MRQCLICYDLFDEEENDPSPPSYQKDFDLERGNTGRSPSLVNLSPCSHEFCQECLVIHIQTAVERKQVPIVCPQVQCQTTVSQILIAKLLADSAAHGMLWRQWKRLQNLADHPNLVECPHCNNLVQGPDPSTMMDKDDLRHNDLTCQHCQRNFCRVHGESHAGQTCTQFNAKGGQQALEETERTLDRCTQPCSHCGARLFKQVGCDFVVCPACHRPMCYKCGSHAHLNMRYQYCTKCGGPLHNASDTPRWQLCLAVVFSCLLAIIYPLFALILVLLTGCCGCFACCGRGLDADNPTRLNPWRGMAATWTVLLGPFAVLMDTGDEHWRLHLLPTWLTPRYTRARDLPRHGPAATADATAATPTGTASTDTSSSSP